MQNKANFKMGNINISTAHTKPYANKQRTINNEHYPKQTQSKPISNAKTAYPACRTRNDSSDKGTGGVGETRMSNIEHRILNGEVPAGIRALWSSGPWVFRLGLMVGLKVGYNGCRIIISS